MDRALRDRHVAARSKAAATAAGFVKLDRALVNGRDADRVNPAAQQRRLVSSDRAPLECHVARGIDAAANGAGSSRLIRTDAAFEENQVVESRAANSAAMTVGAAGNRSAVHQMEP